MISNGLDGLLFMIFFLAHAGFFNGFAKYILVVLLLPFWLELLVDIMFLLATSWIALFSLLQSESSFEVKITLVEVEPSLQEVELGIVELRRCFPCC